MAGGGEKKQCCLYTTGLQELVLEFKGGTSEFVPSTAGI